MTMTTTAAPAPQRALVHPWLDFWLLGGLSFLGLAVVWYAVDVMKLDIKQQIPWWAYYAAFAVNYPHFAYSYQLFYRNFNDRLFGEGTEFVNRIRLAIAGIIVPMLLIGYFMQAGFLQDRVLLSYGVSAMLFFVGWHYVKQGYGVLITASVYKGIFYGNWQKRILFGNVYVIWIYTWLRFNAYLQQNSYYDISYYTFDLPPQWVATMADVALVSTVLTVGVLLWVWLKQRKGLALSGIVGYASAVYFWVMLSDLHAEFMYFIPLFHSLQYLPFVYRFKKSEFLQKQLIATEDVLPPKVRWLRPVGFALAGVALGGLLMDILPNEIDKVLTKDWVSFSRNYFIVSFLLFINIHHFFIDSAFWRRDNKDVQQYLFRA